MNLGHGRAGHLPDYSFARYRYLPAWGNYEEILKDNPTDYWHAFCQPNACNDWRQLGNRMTGTALEPFDLSKHQREYLDASEQDKDDTFLGKFFVAALAQKSLVTNRIFHAGNLLAGISLDYREKGFGGIRDYLRLVRRMSKEASHE